MHATMFPASSRTTAWSPIASSVGRKMSGKSSSNRQWFGFSRRNTDGRKSSSCSQSAAVAKETFMGGEGLKGKVES